jgi:hypothetical protein
MTAAYAASSAAGLHTLGGNQDAGANITGEIRSGTPGGRQVQRLGKVYVGHEGEGEFVLIVIGRSSSWEYQAESRDSGVTAFKPGMGIRESYLGLGFRNVAGADFRIDYIEADVYVSTNRRK